MILPAQSLEWVKIHRPAGTAAYFLGKRLPRLARWTIPIARVADSVLRRFLPFGSPRPDGIVSRPITAADFAEAARPFLAHYDLKPDPVELGWFVEQAGLQTKYGPLQIREVVDRIGRRDRVVSPLRPPRRRRLCAPDLALPNREELVVGQMSSMRLNSGPWPCAGRPHPT